VSSFSRPLCDLGVVSNKLNFDPHYAREKSLSWASYIGFVVAVRLLVRSAEHVDARLSDDWPKLRNTGHLGYGIECLPAERGYLRELVNSIANQFATPKEPVILLAKLPQDHRAPPPSRDGSNFLTRLDLSALTHAGFESTICCNYTGSTFIWHDELARKVPISCCRVTSLENLCCVATGNDSQPKISNTSLLCTRREELF
jgi:hypothetical protein